MTHVNLAVVTEEGECSYCISGWKEAANPLLQDPGLCRQLAALALQKDICLCQDLPGIYFGAVRWFQECTVILGPFTESDISPGVVKIFAARHGIRLRPINRCFRYVITAALGQMYHLCTGKEISFSDLGDEVVVKDDLDSAANAQIMNVLLRQYERAVPHNDGSWEIIRRKCIMAGEPEGVQRHRDAPFSGVRGVIGPNKLRNAKNLAIVDVTVSSRAALDAGLDSETVYTVSDGYILQLEQVQSEAEADALAHIAALEFAKLVRGLHEEEKTPRPGVSQYVIAARDFIIRNVYSRLPVKFIADNVGISPDYLEELFRRELNTSVNEYVINAKIDQSIVLMRDRSLTLQTIVTMLGYSSMSNYIAQFKKRRKLTPSKFRQQLFNNYAVGKELPETVKRAKDNAKDDAVIR